MQRWKNSRSLIKCLVDKLRYRTGSPRQRNAAKRSNWSICTSKELLGGVKFVVIVKFGNMWKKCMTVVQSISVLAKAFLEINHQSENKWITRCTVKLKTWPAQQVLLLVRNLWAQRCLKMRNLCVYLKIFFSNCEGTQFFTLTQVLHNLLGLLESSHCVGFSLICNRYWSLSFIPQS